MLLERPWQEALRLDPQSVSDFDDRGEPIEVSRPALDLRQPFLALAKQPRQDCLAIAPPSAVVRDAFTNRRVIL
ncbi:hypothetical protein GCM10011581_37710 [Saccharopolyspora subtropica]|uniref:Uncharacterized protein n=1 Tax=Saccharopolyspora thermophila TaxID=89367 RepID=A0A917K1A6_9PSEU|nr:hypothetical protein GCM10011581_37710 [Saccharopolyspora subtropica]